MCTGAGVGFDGSGIPRPKRDREAGEEKTSNRRLLRPNLLSGLRPTSDTDAEVPGDVGLPDRGLPVLDGKEKLVHSERPQVRRFVWGFGLGDQKIRQSKVVIPSGRPPN